MFEVNPTDRFLVEREFLDSSILNISRLNRHNNDLMAAAGRKPRRCTFRSQVGPCQSYRSLQKPITTRPFPPLLGVTYAGVDYWGGQAHLNDAKWCDDRLLDVPLSVIWPELTPAGGQSWYTSEDPKFITISVGANGAPNPNEAMTQQLEIQAGEGLQAAIPLGRDEIEASKTWSEQVGLYMVEANTFSPANRRRVFWEELTDGSFRVVIVCTINTATGRSRCSQKFFDKERNVWVTINYRAQLFSKWRDLDKSSIELIDSLTIKHKDER